MADEHKNEGRLSLRVTPDTIRRLRRWADRAGLSMHAYCKQALLVGSVDLARRLGVYDEDDIDRNGKT